MISAIFNELLSKLVINIKVTLLCVTSIFLLSSCNSIGSENEIGRNNENSCYQELGEFTDSRDGETYKTVTIGNQTWLAENLNFETEDSWCFDEDPSNCEIYGRLYQWDALMDNSASSNSNPSGVQGVCPNGWHVPSDKEWQELEAELGMPVAETTEDGWRGTNQGSKLAGDASGLPIRWLNGDLIEDSEFCSSGFGAIPGNGRGPNGFRDVGPGAHFWSSTENEDNEDQVWRRLITYEFTEVYRKASFSSYKYYGYSARCVKD